MAIRKQVVVVDTVEDLFGEDGEEVIGREFHDKQGNKWKVKVGRGGALKKKWGILDGCAGKAIELSIDQFKGYDFIADFELVRDKFVEEAARKVQQEPSGQERGMWWKELGEMIRAGKIDLNTPEGKLRVMAYWAKMDDVLNYKIEENSSETSTVPKVQSSEAKPTNEPPKEGDEITVTNAATLMQWAQSHGKMPSWVRKETNLTDTVMTDEQAVEVYHTLKEMMKW